MVHLYPIGRLSVVFAGFIAVYLLIPQAFAQTTRPATSPSQRGAFHQVFTEGSPLTPIEVQHQRHHIPIDDVQRYRLADESFEMFVPHGYDGAVPFGIMVWVNAGDRGDLPRGWDELLGRHRLIGIGANNSGNRRGVGVRFGLAIDAVHNLKKLYNIDEARIYVSGTSGGARVATQLGVIYPEIFSGAIGIVGSSYFRRIPLPDEPNKYWRPMFDRPPPATYLRARTRSRFAFITGPDDFNRREIVATYYSGFRKDGFKNVELIEVPGLGHRIPEPEWIEKAIESLDAPLSARAGPSRTR